MTRLRTVFWALGFLYLMGVPTLLAQGAQDILNFTQSPIRSWTDEQGLTQPSIHGLVKDRQGYVWIGTGDGLFRFNGRSLERVTPLEGNPAPSIQCLLAASDGALWVGRYAGGLSRLGEGAWAHFPSLGGQPNLSVLALAETPDHRIFAGTSKGLFTFHGTGWIQVPGTQGDVQSLALGPEALWVGTSEGLARVQGDLWQWFKLKDGLPGLRISALASTRSPAGKEALWVGTDRGLAYWEEGRFLPLPKGIQPPSSPILSLALVERPEGPVLWVGTGSGLGVWSGSGWRFLDQTSRLPSPAISALLAEAPPGLPMETWIGTDAGLARIQAGPWRSVVPPPGHALGTPFPIVEVRSDHQFWIGTTTGLSRFRDGVWHSVPELRGRRLITLLGEGPPSNPTVWVGGRDGELFRLQGNRVKALPTLPCELRTLFRPQHADPQHRLWVGTIHGLFRVQNDTWESLAEKGLFPDVLVQRIVEVPDWDGVPVLLVATTGRGIAKFREGAFSWLSSPETPQVQNLLTLALVQDPAGTPWLWGGTPSSGLHRAKWQGPTLQWEPVPVDEPGQPSRVVYGLEQDGRGRVYVFSSLGVMRFTPRAEGFGRETFTTADGLPANDCNSNGSLVDSTGRIWASTVKGLAIFDPTEDIPDLTPRPLRLESLLVGGRKCPLMESTFKSRQKEFRFSFALLSYHRPEDTRYRTQLMGLEPTPNAWTEQPFREFPTLPPGRYVFQVWAKDYAGNLSGPESLPFRIQPPFWQTGWAYLLYLAAVSGSIVGLVRWRLSRLEREKVALEQLVEERTRSLAESHAQALALETSQARAEAEAKAKSEFLANMSHEIRTPMNAVIGFAHLGLKLNLEPRPRDYFQKIGNAAKSLLGIINDILDFTKIEAGRLELEAIPFRITDVMHQVADLVSPKASEKGVELLVSLAEDVPRSVIGDPLRLGQVLMNLAGNAIKFTEQGQVLVRVEVVRNENRKVLLRFRVKDSGIGMGPEALDRLFQAFTQADTSMTRRFGGTGLGLVISKRLVDLMGGEIQVESEAGRGSTFAFTAAFETAEVQPEPRRGLRPDLWGLKVLVVDDNATARQVFHEQVRSLGFEVTSVGSGMDALMEVERAEASHPYDLVLMDWRLQGVDGVETARRIHRNLRLAHVPTILLMTAFGREEAMRNAEQAGIQGFIAKPVNPDLLMDAILEAMGRGQEPVPIPKDSSGTTTAQNLLAGARILLAEDNPINQEVATEILTAAGIRVDVANNGVEAVRKAGEADYDAILMDVQMPEMDGKAATAHIREQPRNKDLPIIAMTAHAMAGYREECLAAGMNDYLSKPIDPQNLFEILGRWIKGREPVALEPEARSPKPETLIDPTGAFDVAAGLRRLGGNQAFYLRLVGGFATDFTRADQEISAALDAGDLAKAEHLAHTLKGVAGNLSAVALAHATGPLEAALRVRNAEAAREALPAFEAALARALTAAPKLAETLESPSTPAPATKGRAVEELLKELETRLGQGDPRAEETWKELAAALPGPAFEGPLRELGEGLEAFDFRGASATLKDLQEALKNHNEGGS